MKEKSESVAILVLNYNAKKYLSVCLNGLLKQSYKDLDIWLVDNNSSDDSIKYTKKY